MEQEKILELILSKLDNIEKEQREMKNEQQEMKADIKGINKELKTIKQDVREIKSIQETIQQFMLSTEKAIEVYDQDHKFIEKLKNVVGK
ncbi:hypothetical protein [Wukongibacter sp. M2B1]|uniref:hypothetical protein n=1 Tax=Wukongibacter sp. M2B1 TaxID=3088895 RepID=UPI003D7C13DF